MATASKLEAVTLRGPPRKLTGLVPVAAAGPGVLPLTAKLPGGAAILRGSLTPFGARTSEIRLELPRETPPGRYGGVTSLEGKNLEVVLLVEPSARLRIHPKQTTLTAAAGSRTEFSVTVVNLGNIPIEIPRSADLDMEDDDEQDRALGKALRAELGESETRMERILEEIRETHGGEARITVAKGAGMVGPAESCELSVVLDVPVTVKPGRTYTGGWEIGDDTHPISLTAEKGDTQQRRPRGRRKT